MTMDSEDASTPTTDDQVRVSPGFLESLIIMSQRMGAHGLTISVMVGGKWLTGEITTERAFLDYAVRKFASSITDDPDGFDDVATKLSAGAFKHLLEQPLREENGVLPVFLFLRDACCIDGNVSMNFASESILRIRIDSIDAIQLGRSTIEE